MATIIKKQQSALLRPLGAFFRRFHLLIFFVFIVGCLAASVVLLNQTLTETSSQDYTSTINAGSIDQATLERIQSLHPSTESTPTPELPAGRVNPFAE